MDENKDIINVKKSSIEADFPIGQKQLKDLRNIGQSQCSGKSYEFNIETWEVT